MRKKVSIADPVQLDETLDQQNYTRSCLGRGGGVGVMQGMHVPPTLFPGSSPTVGEDPGNKVVHIP